MPETTPRLQLENIVKSFPGVLAVQDVSLTAYPGEILALLGENGAGKTTLMNVLTGALQADSGRILLDGQVVTVGSPSRALSLGITMIHQELALIPQLTVGQNIFLGREPRRSFRAVIDWQALYEKAQKELDRLGLNIPVRAAIAELPIAQRQLVEIAKALSYQARLIILDEPTSALTEREAETLFKLMRSLKEQGVTLIFISHRLEEVFALSDRIAVMRDGHLVGVAATPDLTPERVVHMMVGRELREFYTGRGEGLGEGSVEGLTEGRVSATEPDRTDNKKQADEFVLRASGLRRGRDLVDVDLALRRGEIVGMAGLVGAGRTFVARSLFGADRLEAGNLWIDGKPVNIRSPRDAIRLGIGFVPEDRKSQGLFLGQSVRTNIAISILESLSRLGFLDFNSLERLVRKMIDRLGVRTPGSAQKVRNLSGGNQQKVVIARWLARDPKVLILDEPTRGVDVAAKAEIHALMRDLADRGVAILMISSELPEILGVSDRVLVMREGRIVAEIDRPQATQDAIMRAATAQAEGLI